MLYNTEEDKDMHKALSWSIPFHAILMECSKSSSKKRKISNKQLNLTPHETRGVKEESKPEVSKKRK
jgi:hypothetical protein